MRYSLQLDALVPESSRISLNLTNCIQLFVLINIIVYQGDPVLRRDDIVCVLIRIIVYQGDPVLRRLSLIHISQGIVR